MTNQELNVYLEEFKSQEKSSELDFLSRIEQRKLEGLSLQQRADEELFPNLQEATEENYLSWLKGFMGNGGIPTHYYDRELDGNFYVAVKKILPLPLYGSMRINIIVPRDIEVEDGDW